MLNFKKIELNDIDSYRKFIVNSKEFSCENAFVNLLVWQCAYNNMMTEVNGQLFIKSGEKGRESFRLPIGGELREGIKLIEEYCGGKPRLWAQQGPILDEFMSNFGNEYTVESHRDAFDYIYLTEDLATLSGKRYHSKRNHISAFSKKYDWSYRTVNAENLEEIKDLAELWYNENSHRLNDSMRCEKNGINIILDNMEYLGIKGGAIYVENKPVAFTLGSPINKEVFDIHIEKALSDFGEAYTVINREFAKNELTEYKYINREDDMGLEGLRKAKLSYKPHILLEKYSLVRKD